MTTPRRSSRALRREQQQAARRRFWLTAVLILTVSGAAGFAITGIASRMINPSPAPSFAAPPEPQGSAEPDPTAHPTSPAPTSGPTTAESEPEPSPTPESTGLAATADISDPTSLLIVVNKHRPLDPIEFAPRVERIAGTDHDVHPAAAKAYRAMSEAAAADGVPLRVLSGYRSYQRQHGSYSAAINRNGTAIADRVSARPGFSEHQTGLAIDIGDLNTRCDVRTCFPDTAAGVWVEAHAHEFGFITRYPKDAQDVTGFTFEPWHQRFVGVDAAAEILASGAQTLEEFFGLAPASDYL